MISVRKSLTKGVFYTALARYSGIVVTISINAVLARLITPKEFGIVALITVFVAFFNLLSDFGLGPAVVQNQKLDEDDVRSVFSFSLLFGIALAATFCLTAPFIAGFYNEPELEKVTRYLSLSVLFNSFMVIPCALLQKTLKFRQIGLINVCVQSCSGVAAIIMAYKGFGYYSLVAQSIFASVAAFVAFYATSPVKWERKIKWMSIRKIIRFSAFQFMFNFINYFSRNTDNILIGKYMGSVSLGYYDKAYRLMMMPVANLTYVITPVLMPLLSKYQDDKSFIFESYLKVVKILAIIGFPLSVFLYFTADEIVLLLFGAQWTKSVPVFRLLAITVGIQMILSSTGSIFQSVNRTDLLFLSGCLSAIVMISGISYGIFIGKSLESVGYGLIIAFTINFFQAFYLLIKKALKQSIIKFLLSLAYPAIMSIFLFVAGIYLAN